MKHPTHFAGRNHFLRAYACFLPVFPFIMAVTVMPAGAQNAPAGNYEPGTVEYSPEPSSTATPHPEGRLYYIRKGDTLWDLAYEFLGDSFRWQELWRRNPYITDPHWIYPGNELSISGVGLGTGTGSSNTGSKADGRLSFTFENATAGFFDMASARDEERRKTKTDSVETDMFHSITTLVRRKILTAAFLAETPFLWMEKDAQGKVFPGEGRIARRRDKNSEIYQLFEQVHIRTYGDNTYRVGDTVAVYRSLRMMTVNDRKANLVRRIAWARVDKVDKKKATATLFRITDVVKENDRVGRSKPFSAIPIDGYIEPPIPVEATVRACIRERLFPYLYDSFIIAKGRSEGIRVGDLFATFGAAEQGPESNPAHVACAAHVGDDHSTLVIVRLSDKELQAGDRVKLLKKLKSEQ